MMIDRLPRFPDAMLARGEQAAFAGAALLAAFMLAGLAAFAAQHGVAAGQHVAAFIGPSGALALLAALGAGLWQAGRMLLR